MTNLHAPGSEPILMEHHTEQGIEWAVSFEGPTPRLSRVLARRKLAMSEPKPEAQPRRCI